MESQEDVNKILSLLTTDPLALQRAAPALQEVEGANTTPQVKQVVLLPPTIHNPLETNVPATTEPQIMLPEVVSTNTSMSAPTLTTDTTPQTSIIEAVKQRKRKYSRKSEGMEAEDRDELRETTSTKDAWNRKFAELKQFALQEGHCNPSYLSNSRLYNWLHRQKFLHRTGKLPEDKVELLQSIGVSFDYHWDEMFNLLKAYCEQHGTWVIQEEDDSKLYSWLYFQICCWKTGKLPEDRIHKLENIGITINNRDFIKSPRVVASKRGRKRKGTDEERDDSGENPQKKDAKWVENYNRLKSFKESHGTTEVSADVDRYLSIWVHAQQRNWREGKLQAWKKQLLEQLEVDPHFERKRNKESVYREDEGGSITEEEEHQMTNVGKVVEEVVLQNGSLNQGGDQTLEGADSSVLQPLILALLENQERNS